ncbi:hypothetical protein LTR56_021991 [Elasticomyces elasticus]|nr:hypothetical protein LTR56_021991 [Elasticomyces elasticus]KAK3630221.1 hypothetical protein LTR22_021599 [Elasticomyces elasticus]KAK4920153.1 hypothetical protein LTR49_012252 [Elasticomyces elasticus]KAK5748952.1 hypothetical protein LTS12_020989 [Elasticomyces elasticus]
MARAFDAADLCHQEKYTDITIEFGTRQRKCHKVILCSKSTYFEGLCSPGGKFVESKQPTIKLEGDEEEGVEAKLRWLYTFDYKHRVAQPPRQCCRTPGREDIAQDLCLQPDNENWYNNADENEVSRIFGAFREEGSTYAQSIIDVVNVVQEIRLKSLLQNTDFRALLFKDSALCMEALDRMIESKGQQRTPEFSDDYV